MSVTSQQQPIVIKIGGTLLSRMDTLDRLWTELRRLQDEAPVVLVHGGGAQATAMAERLGHEPRIVQGRRVTSDLDMDIMQWTLRGALNTRLVSQAVRNGVSAVGVSGVDGQMLEVTKRPPWMIEGEEVDFGWVGDVERVDPALLQTLLGAGFVPVVAPLGFDEDGDVFNVNADTVARAVAEALRAHQLLLVTEAGGVRREVNDEASQLTECSAATFESGRDAGWIEGGMRVKLDVAFDALEAGIEDVYILSVEDLADRRHGTKVVR